jgi:ketol-acid reductoisomerase
VYLMGALAGIMEAQYKVLRENGHSPSEAFNETVEELTESLIKLVSENGMDWMYGNCSTTAQRGALDWKGPFREAVLPCIQRFICESSSWRRSTTLYRHQFTTGLQRKTGSGTGRNQRF